MSVQSLSPFHSLVSLYLSIRKGGRRLTPGSARDSANNAVASSKRCRLPTESNHHQPEYVSFEEKSSPWEQAWIDLGGEG
jgi:hypothetical protein